MLKTRTRILASLLLALLLTAAAGCTPAGQTAEEEVVRIVNVEVATLQPQPFAANVRITGTVEALRDVTLVAEEGGVVEEILLRKGERVTAGQVIARLDAEILTAQLEEARAASELAGEQWKRQQRLWENDSIGTELEYIQARENARMRAAMVRTLETRLRKKTIRSPIAGTFEDYFTEVGEFAVPLSPFARIIALEETKITGGVPERYSGDVRVGTRVELQFDAIPDEVFDARISFVGDAVEPQARTFPVEIRLTNPGRRLKPGMIANVRIIRRQLQDVIVVPQEAILRTTDGYQVFVIERETDRMVARARSVTLGPAQFNRVVITQGLRSDEKLVTVGQLKLGDGDVVNVVNGGEGR